MSEMYARLTREGVAASETAVCGRCIRSASNEQIRTLYADDTVTGFEDCSGNEALSCQLCGVETE